jgi:hypothetical protein
MMRRLVCAGVVAWGGLVSVRAAGLAPASVSYTAAGAAVSVHFDLPEVRRQADGLLEVVLPHALAAEQAGQPVLPEAVVAIPLPEGAQIAGCVVTPSECVVLALDGVIRHGQCAFSYAMGPDEPVAPDPAIYALDRPYPEEVSAGWSVEQRGPQRIAIVRLTPVQYVPADGVLLAHQRLHVALTWGPPTVSSVGAAIIKASSPALRAPASAAQASPGRFDYVVITAPDLLATAGPYNFQALCAARTRGGLMATNVTTEWIYANYAGTRPDGGVDNPTRIRNFIRDAYDNWGTRFVLLGGTAARLPTRGLYGSVLTGGGALVDTIASDMYYGCLDGTFDGNANGVYGEATDGEGGQDVDLVAEVYVGRFPVDTATEVAWMVRKTLAYEQATPEQLRKVSHLGEFLGFGGISDYATAAMEQLRLGGTYDGYATKGFGNAVQASQFDATDGLYDRAGYTWGNGEVLRRFQSNGHVFNHLGHGNYGYCFRLNTGSSSDQHAMASLTNASYFMAYSQACEAGRFDDRADCLAETLVTVSNGPAALIMNSRDGWGLGYSTDGPSQRFHRYFWHELLGGGSYRLGEANQKSKEDVRFAVNYYGGAMRWCYYELTLFGDPALAFGATISPLPPTIEHIPLQNQLATDTAYRVVATFGPVGLYEPDAAEMIWTSTLLPDQVNTTRFAQVAGSCYEAWLPAAACGATYTYTIRLASRAGLTVVSPATGAVRFAVTPVFALQVTGSPQEQGVVTPAYGVSQVASGNWIQARAPWRVPWGIGCGWRCDGWSGSGSVPASGASNTVAFQMTGASGLTWLWTEEYALAQATWPAGIFVTNRWCDAGATTETVVAPDRAVQGGTNYQFAGWYLDGQRWPEVGRATHAVPLILMDRPRAAVARYVPATLDADADGVPDWWELYYYGDTDRGAADDTDGDGAGLRLEYLALSDPLDRLSFPLPPAITVTPLAAVQTVPPPFNVAVTIAGSAPLEVTQLVWQRNQGVTQRSPLVRVAGGTNQYAGTLAGEAAAGDLFAYWVQATGRDGLSAQSAVYTTRLQYAVMSLVPPLSRTYHPDDAGWVGDVLAITNSGTAALTWQACAGFGEYADDTPQGWNLAALGTPWTRSTARSLSAPAALRATITSPFVPTGRSQHAAMTSPAITLGDQAILAFRYWINAELDMMRAGYCWDGGIVEISTNGGVSYVQLSGPYTHTISGWSASAWPEGTRCLAGAGEGWREATFDLSAFAGAAVIIRFHYGADDNTDREGWYVDNIRVAPLLPGADGVTLSPPQGVVTPGSAANLAVSVDTTALPRRWVRLPVLVRGSDPITPTAWYDLTIDNRFPHVLTLVGTNGAVIGSANRASTTNGTDFGAWLVGAGSHTNLFSLVNWSDEPLNISFVGLAGPDITAFALGNLPATLAAHTTNTIAIVFTPQGGHQEARFDFVHSGTNSPFVLRVAGFGIRGGLQLATDSVFFAAHYQGAAPPAQTVGLANIGGSAFTYTNWISYGAGASGWLHCSTGQVAAGCAALLTNVVDPRGLAAGVYVATNVIGSANASNSPQAYVVTLTVTKAPQTISCPALGRVAVTNVVALLATASSALPVDFAILDGPAVLRNQTEMSFQQAGHVRVCATQAGDENWLPAMVTNGVDVVGVITNVTPDVGTIYGGTPVTICGLWLGNGTDITQVTLCDIPATIISQSVHTVSVLAGASCVATNGAVRLSSDGFGLVVLPCGFTYQPVPPPPLALSAVDMMTNRFTARWQAAESATNYLLDVSTLRSFVSKLSGYDSRAVGDVTACLVTGLTAQATYYYRVRAVNGYGSSTYSDTMPVTVGTNGLYLLYEPPAGVGSAAAVDVIDLSRLVHGVNMRYAVMDNTQTGLVSAAFAGTNLILRYAAGTTGGTARITVRVTSADGSCLDTVVMVTVVPAPALVMGPVALNRQTGLYEQSVLVSNVSPTLAAQAVALTVTNLAANFSLYNATGRDLAGNPEIYWTGTLPAQSAMSFLLQYYTATRGTLPAPTVRASLRLVAPIRNMAGPLSAIGRIRSLGGPAQSVMLEFAAIPGHVYYIQYTDALTNGWKTVYPGIEALVNRLQWLDAGPPATTCLPGMVPARFYRLIEE